MIKTNKQYSLALILFMGFGFCIALDATAQDEGAPAARVVALQGEVFVQRGAGEKLPLARRDSLQVADVISTTADAWLQLRFSDGALLSLSCNSVLELRDYQYQDRQDDRVHLFLHRGRARTISGAIQRANYRFTTEMVEINVFGTDYAVGADSATDQFFGAYDGAIRIRSNGREIRIGAGQSSSFAQFKLGEEPVALVSQPPQLSLSVLGGVSCTD